MRDASSLWPSPSGLWQDAGHMGGSSQRYRKGCGMSVHGLPGSGTTGSDPEPARGRGAQQARAERVGAELDRSERARTERAGREQARPERGPAAAADVLEAPAPGAPAPGEARETQAYPRPGVTLLGRGNGPATAGTPARAPAPERHQ